MKTEGVEIDINRSISINTLTDKCHFLAPNGRNHERSRRCNDHSDTKIEHFGIHRRCTSVVFTDPTGSDGDKMY